MKNEIKKLFHARDSKNTLQKAANLYGYKTAIQKGDTFNKIASASRMLLGIISIITAFGAVNYFLQSFVNSLYLTASISVLILLFIEVIKHYTALNVFSDMLTSYKDFSLFSVIYTLLFAGSTFASVYLSFNGAEILHQQQNKRVDISKQLINNRLDSINSGFNSLINTVVKEEESYKNSVSWRGKIDVHNTTTKQKLKSFDNRRNQIEAERVQALEMANNEAAEELQKEKKNFQFTADTVFYAALINESFILLFVFFVSYYLYKVHEEEEVIESFTPSKYNNNFLRLIDSLQGGVMAGQIAAQETAKSIGFKMPTKEAPQSFTNEPKAETKQPINNGFNTSINKPFDIPKEDREPLYIVDRVEEQPPPLKEAKGFLSKYKEVVASFNDGLSHSQIMAKHGISKSTSQSIKRSLKLIQAYEKSK